MLKLKEKDFFNETNAKGLEEIHKGKLSFINPQNKWGKEKIYLIVILFPPLMLFLAWHVRLENPIEHDRRKTILCPLAVQKIPCEVRIEEMRKSQEVSPEPKP